MAEKTYKLTSPLSITYGYDRRGKAKVFSLNLNIYRNFNRFALGEAKKAYARHMQEQVDNLPTLNQISIKYVLFTGSNRKIDIMNIMSIVDKFFCDCLTERNKITDDNYTVLSYVEFQFGGVDKANPRVDIFIKDLV